jgi:hypothetical protein
LSPPPAGSLERPVVTMPETEVNLKAPNMKMHNNAPIGLLCLLVVFL